MTKVKVYNIKEMVERESEHKFRPRESTLAIIETDKGIIVTDNEAVHALYDNTDSEYEVQLFKITKKNTIEIIPTATVDIPINYIKENATCQEVELTEFVRYFSDRIECSYQNLLRTLKGCGLNPNNYQRKVATNA